MSIPIDKLYHFIESISKKINKGDVLIYRFFPHGSKKLKDLELIRSNKTWKEWILLPEVVCHDQEPLDYNYYTTEPPKWHEWSWIKEALQKHPEINNYKHFNLRYGPYNIYDKCLLIHSEQRSKDLEQYSKDQFIPVYYWSHALISLDWYRFAKHEIQTKSVVKTFLIYNRAWSNTREYRLKFIDLLIDYKLVDYCQATVKAIEPQLEIHYQDYEFKNQQWRPQHQLEDYFVENQTPSHYSADYDISDYNATDIEIVLETLFDDSRLHLTEKTLRPIACGQPFILAATHGSLNYLKQYGFKTFSEVINESYDNIIDPYKRLEAIVKEMDRISRWTASEREVNMIKLNEIAEYNRQHFFSTDFYNYVVNELEENLKKAFTELPTTRNGKVFLDFRKFIAQYPEIRDLLTAPSPERTTDDIIDILKRIRGYKNS